jgi:hypothetical protein
MFPPHLLALMISLGVVCVLASLLLWPSNDFVMFLPSQSLEGLLIRLLFPFVYFSFFKKIKGRPKSFSAADDHPRASLFH